MADDSKPGTNLASSGIVVAALVATGAYFFQREAPLLDSRPPRTNASIEQLARAQNQTIDARLWQDPLSAVAKAIDKSELRKLETQCKQHPDSDSRCKPPFVKHAEMVAERLTLLAKGRQHEEQSEALVLGVMVLGAPYPEDDEQRRRTRYSVLAGLERAGFVPKDARHIGYFLWPRTNEDAPVVPYEWFQPRGFADPTQDILVMWLNEADLQGQPLARLSSLIRKIRGYRGEICVPVDGKNFRIVGPFSSDLLHDMVNEAQASESPCPEYEAHWPQLKEAQFYAYGASAPDLALQSGNSGIAVREIGQYFDKYDLKFQRMVASDDTLAGGIVKELGSRLDAGRSHFSPGQEEHIALVSEWDTFYGQTLPQAVESEFKTTRGLRSNQIHEFTYLRGLDGLLPQPEETGKQKQDKSANPAEAPAGAADFFKLETDNKTLERPIGESQFDYLRRISEQLHKVDDKLRRQQQPGKLKAIGVLGSDVFDKLLILRALRPEFPEALFFTTDFDEDYTIKSELPYTRNLIISSSFGPSLSENFQARIPLFRDTYQTSTFLSTLSAIGDPAANWKTSEILADSIAEQLKAPRIFEIKRNGDVLSFAWNVPPDALRPPQRHKSNGAEIVSAIVVNAARSGAVASSKECWRDDDPAKCGYIQPVDVEEQQKLEDSNAPKIMDTLYPTFEERSSLRLALGLALGAVLTFSLLAFRNIRKHVVFEMVLASLGLGVAALACYNWECVAQYLTEQGNGEPIALLDGVSLWPTVLLRVFGILLAVCFIRRVMCGLNENLMEVAEELKLEPEPVSLCKQITGIWLDIISGWKKLARLFHPSHRNNLAAPSSIDAEAAWKVYVGHERFWPRCLRALLYTAGMFAIGMLVLAPIFGMPVNPARGMHASYWYFGTTMGYVLLMQFLTFFIFDATLFCLLFVNDLRRAQTLWPAATTEIYDGRLRMQTKLVHDWIDLDFVVKRTTCIGSLIYFPFVLIALLIVTRSTVFANYAPSLTILLMQGLSLAVVFACAIMLCWAAKNVRDTTRKNLTDGIIRAKDSRGDSRFASQLESLLSRVDLLKDGAFGSFTQQPLVRAVLLPLGSFGWTALVEKGMFPGL
ncbi:hypothetical protein QEV83_00505 [Methylocapsa sp. D3K7]|uniref:hypothetical protein n=1 Tax=Methylocapsa sp. D3K7 TaxID=3041435 RepID=UPI00244EBC81|nr:hypothetical protein [Methylocapsa sp. D3K7]WGJ14839.1 hypothetical protein QEV83_00505 [Methylocapsa sp. D3K7]